MMNLLSHVGRKKRPGSSFGNRKGFTLIELLISMSIFIVFLGIVSQSYVGIIRSQRQANGVRKIYSELRVFFETLAQDARLGSPAYDCYEVPPKNNNFDQLGALCPAEVTNPIQGGGKQNYLVLVDKENTELTVYRFNPTLQTAQVKKYSRSGDWQAEGAYIQGAEGVDSDGYRNLLSNDVKIKNLGFDLNPAVNPYAALNVDKSGDQFQPLVNVFLTAENVGQGLTPFKLDLQTSFSSRVYSRK